MALNVNLDQLLQHREFLTALARGLVVDPSEQDELVWETMGEGAMRPPRLEGKAHAGLKPWLAGVMRNQARSRKRARLRRQVHEQAGSRPEEVESAADVAARLELFQDLATHVQALETDYRDVVLFRFFENLPPREIAKRMALPVETVKVRLRRALAMLRARLDREHGARDKWLGSLLPLAYPGAKATLVGTTALGVLMMTLKTKAVLAASAALLLLGAGLMYVVSETGQHDAAGVVELESSFAPEVQLERRDSDRVDRAVVDSAKSGVPGSGRATLETGWAGEIQGFVLSALSVPVRKAKVSLYRFADVERQGALAPVRASEKTDERGVFRMRGLGYGHYVIRVEAEGFAVRRSELRLNRPAPKRLGMRIVLVEGYTLEGRVVDSAGKGVAGAWLVVSGLDGVGVETEVRSDREGRFRFSLLPRGEAQILAWAEGHGLGSARCLVGADKEARVLLSDEKPFKLRIRVAQSKQKGIAKPGDVLVWLGYWAAGRPHLLPSPIRYLSVPAEGEVSARGLRAGTWSLWPRSFEAAMSDRRISQRLSLARPEARVVLDWQAAEPLRGRLAYKDGKPAGGVALEVSSRDYWDVYTVRSDVEGCFTFPAALCAKGDMRISLVSKGLLFDLGSWRTLHARILAGPTERLLTVLRTPVWSGRVVDERGLPVPFAEVWLRSGDSWRVNSGNTKTDDKGVFEISLDQDAQKPVVLDARSARAFCSDPLIVTSERGSKREGLVLRLVPGATIEGEVVDGTGAGIPGTTLHAYYEAGQRPPMAGAKRAVKRNYHTTYGDDEGRFRFLGLPDGLWRIEVKKRRYQKRGYQQQSADPLVRLGKGEKISGLSLVMSAGLSIEGRVLSESGEPMAGLQVSGKFLGDLGKGESDGDPTARCGVDGRFVIKGLRAGPYRLTTSLPDDMSRELGLMQPGPNGRSPMTAHEPFKIQAQAGSKNLRWRLLLPRFGEIRSRFIHSGPPLDRIHVELRSRKDEDVWKFDLPIQQGGLTMKRVLAGSYLITLKSPRFADLKKEIEVKPGEVTDLGLLTLMDLDVIEGRAIDMAGRPLADVWIGTAPLLSALWSYYDPAKGLEPFEGRVLTKSDAQGRFRMPFKGKAKVYAFKSGYVPLELAWPISKSKQKSRKAGSGVAGPGTGLPDKTLTLRLRQCAELAVLAPALVPGIAAKWGARLTRLPPASERASPGYKSPPTAYLWLKPAKIVRFLGLQPGRYSLETLNWNKTKRYQKETVPGETYNVEVQIQIGTERIIKIP